MRKAHIVQLRAFVEPPTERLRTAAPKTVRTRVNDVQLKSRSYPKKSDNNPRELTQQKKQDTGHECSREADDWYDRRPNMVTSSLEYNTMKLGGPRKVTTRMMAAIDETRSDYQLSLGKCRLDRKEPGEGPCTPRSTG